MYLWKHVPWVCVHQKSMCTSDLYHVPNCGFTFIFKGIQKGMEWRLLRLPQVLVNQTLKGVKVMRRRCNKKRRKTIPKFCCLRKGGGITMVSTNKLWKQQTFQYNQIYRSYCFPLLRCFTQVQITEGNKIYVRKGTNTGVRRGGKVSWRSQ